MDNSSRIVSIQNQIDQEQTRHRNRMEQLKKQLEYARKMNEFYGSKQGKLFKLFDTKSLTTSQLNRLIKLYLD